MPSVAQILFACVQVCPIHLFFKMNSLSHGKPRTHSELFNLQWPQPPTEPDRECKQRHIHSKIPRHTESSVQPKTGIWSQQASSGPYPHSSVLHQYPSSTGNIQPNQLQCLKYDFTSTIDSIQTLPEPQFRNSTSRSASWPLLPNTSSAEADDEEDLVDLSGWRRDCVGRPGGMEERSARGVSDGLWDRGMGWAGSLRFLNTRQCHGYTSTASRDCVSRGRIVTLLIWLRSDQDNNRGCQTRTSTQIWLAHI